MTVKNKRGSKEIHDVILDEIKDMRLENKEARVIASKAREEIEKKVDTLSDKIYKGNGQPSINSRILKNTFITKAVVFAVGALYIAIIGAVVTFTVNKVTETKNEPIPKVTMCEENRG